MAEQPHITVGVAQREVPEWVGPYAREWMDNLMLAEWTVRFRVSPHPHGDAYGGTRATCTVRSNVREAVIELRDDIGDEPDEEWRDTIVHELLHVRLGSMSDYVEQVLMPALPGAAAIALAESGWTRELEAAVEILTQVMRDFENNENLNKEGE